MSFDATFSQKLAEFKAQENPEAVLLLADAPELVRVAVAWTSTAAGPLKEFTQPPANDDPHAWWNWLWENTAYCRRELGRKTDLADYHLDRALRVLIGNRALYPDGTVNSFVQRYLRDKVLKLFQPRSPRSGGKKE